jgi:hypothetical protein
MTLLYFLTCPECGHDSEKGRRLYYWPTHYCPVCIATADVLMQSRDATEDEIYRLNVMDRRPEPRKLDEEP